MPAALGQRWRQRYRWCYGTMQAMWAGFQALVVVQSTVAALLGARQRWHRMHRTGQADLALTTNR